jgi:hypothetical protein
MTVATCSLRDDWHGGDMFAQGASAMADPSLGEIVSWAFILGTFAFVAARRFGAGPALVVAMLAALGTKAALLNLT